MKIESFVDMESLLCKCQLSVTDSADQQVKASWHHNWYWLYVARYSLSFQLQPYNLEELKHSPFDAWFCISLYHSLLQSRAQFCIQFHAIQFYAAIQHDGWHFILKNIWSEPAVRQTAWRWRSYRKGKKLIFLNVLKTSPVKFEQILQEKAYFVSVSTRRPGRLKFLRRNPNTVNA